MLKDTTVNDGRFFKHAPPNAATNTLNTAKTFEDAQAAELEKLLVTICQSIIYFLFVLCPLVWTGFASERRQHSTNEGKQGHVHETSEVIRGIQVLLIRKIPGHTWTSVWYISTPKYASEDGRHLELLSFV